MLLPPPQRVKRLAPNVPAADRRVCFFCMPDGIPIRPTRDGNVSIGRAMSDEKIALTTAWFDERETERMHRALAGGISGDGPFCRRVEGRLATQLGGGRVLLTTSCTHALELALLA